MKSLKAKISDDERLREQVARVWGISSPSSATTSLLIERMQNPFAARSVWLRLDEVERHCLYQALASPARSRGILPETLRRKTKLSGVVVEAALNRLKEQWLLVDEEIIDTQSLRTLDRKPVPGHCIFPFRECSDVLWQTGQELFKASANRAEMPLSRLLSTFSEQDLQNLARQCSLSVPISAPSSHRGFYAPNAHPFDMREQLCEALQQPFRVFELLRRLDAPAFRLFLWLCCEREGKATLPEVQGWLHCEEEHLFALLRLLEMHALAFDSLTPQASRMLVVPGEIFATVKGQVAQLADDERRYAFVPAADEPATIQEGQPWISYDLAVVVGAVHQLVVEPTKDDRLLKRQRTKIRPLLHGRPRLGEIQDDLYPDMVVAAARSFEIIERKQLHEDAKLRYLPGPKLRTDWCRLSLAEQIQCFLEWWIKAARWMDIIPGEPAPTLYSWQVYTDRQALLEQLRACLPGKWYSVETLLYALWKRQPLELNAQGYRKPPVSGGSPLRARWQKWRKMDGTRYLGMLTSTLYEAGIVSIGYEHTPAGNSDVLPIAFLVTELGAAALVAEPSAYDHSAEAVVPALIVQPSFEIVALRMDPAIIYELVTFAEIRCLEQVSRFQLTRASLLHGLATGRPVEEIIAFLERNTQARLAQNVAYTLQDWSKGYQEVSLSEVMLIDASGKEAIRSVQRALEARHVPYRLLTGSIFAVSLQVLSRSGVYKLLEGVGVVVREAVVQ